MNRAHTPAGRQGLSLALALALHAAGFWWLARLPGPMTLGTMPGSVAGSEHVILARLLETRAPDATPRTASPPAETAAAVAQALPSLVLPATSPGRKIPVAAPQPVAPAIALAPGGMPAHTAMPAGAAEASSRASGGTGSTGGTPGVTSGSTQPSAASTGNSFSTPEPELAARPDYAYNPKPDYPSVARQFGLSGKVLVRVLVEIDGAPRQILIADSSGHDILDQAALRSIKHWRFLPARHSGQAYASWIEFNVRFDLAN